MLATGPGCRQTRTSAFLNQAPLKLRERGKDMEDELARRGRCVQRAITQRAKAHLPLSQLGNVLRPITWFLPRVREVAQRVFQAA